MSFVAMILAGLFCGFIDSCLGMGYGVTATSVLVTFGVAPAIASASIHTSESVVDIVSAISHYRNGNVDIRLSKHLLLPGIVASILGAVFLSNLQLSTAKPMVRVVLILLGLLIIYETFNGKKVKRSLNKLQATGLGFIAAFVDVAVGGGWGPIGTPALILSGEEPKTAVGVIEFTEPIISLTAVLTFGWILGFDKFMWDLALPMILGGIVLTPIASIITKMLPRKVLGAFIGLWLVVLNIYGLLF
jgi:uncharacterized membrane protein YfcA